MSNGGGIIIVCGTGGLPITDKTITVYDAPFSVAIKIDKTAIIAELEAQGQTHELATRHANQLANLVERDYWKWGEKMEDIGLPYTRHEPHSQP